MASTRKALKTPTKTKTKKSNELKAALPKDLFRDPDTGQVLQKVDDDGIPNQRYLQLRRQGRV